MVQSPKTSFIPKSTQGNVPSRGPTRKKRFNVLSIAAVVIFLGVLILAVGVFFYERVSTQRLDAAKQELAEMKNTFNQSEIRSILELKQRMDVAELLLERHLSPSIVFDMLEARTQSEVQFEGFTYTRNESGSVFITLDGRTFSFNTVALQGSELRNTPVLDDVLFSNIGIDSGGEGSETIVFKVTTKANGDAIAYRVDEVPVAEEAQPTPDADAGEASADEAEATETENDAEAVSDDDVEASETVPDTEAPQN